MNQNRSHSIEAWGTPVAAVTAPATQDVFGCGNGLLAYVGVNPDVARMVVQSTGDPIAWPFSTLGFWKDGDRVAVFVLHAYQQDEAGARIEVSAEIGGLPLTRPMLGPLVWAIFYGFAADQVLVRVRRRDHRTRHALERMGFAIVGRTLRADRTPGLLYAIDAVTALPRWHRYCRRFWH